MKKIYLFILAAAFFMVSCSTQYAPECTGKNNRPLTVTDLLLDSINYALNAKVNVKDGTEVNVTCNGKTQIAKAGDGEICKK